MSIINNQYAISFMMHVYINFVEIQQGISNIHLWLSDEETNIYLGIEKS
jgi:hypothetical protein